MALSDLTTHPQLILRILEKKEFGREADPNLDEGSIPKLSDRFDTQRENISQKTPIAEFKFPINHEGKTFYYQQYSNTLGARQSTVTGIAGIASEAYGVGLEDITMNGIFPTAADRNVIVSTGFSFEAALTQFTPKDWADNLKRFIKFYLDLNDPYSKIWTVDNYYTRDFRFAFSIYERSGISVEFGGDSGIKAGGKPNKKGYELVIVDEYAKTIQTIQPKSDGLQIFTSKETPFTYGWRLNATVIEDKLDASFKEIPDDILQLMASYRLPAISEIPVIGPLSETLNKLIAISNSISQMMDTILTYKSFPNNIVQQYNDFLYSNQNIAHKIENIAEL